MRHGRIFSPLVVIPSILLATVGAQCQQPTAEQLNATHARTVGYVVQANGLDDGMMPIEDLAKQIISACAIELEREAKAYGSASSLDLIFAEAVAKGQRERRMEPKFVSPPEALPPSEKRF